ncbi:MAG: tripartite tricarboxylate transporter permease [Rhodospirillales bacterium]|nr:tripartite tricarboxylate transporter permease [Rhodospirillales bacterium]
MSFDIGVVLEGLNLVLQPWTLVMIVLGVLGGIMIGVIPGLTATMAVALLIPFTFNMPAEVAMALLVVVYVGGISGGCMTAILIRMPGTPASVATLLDGFPMTQQGKGGTAIGNAVVASFFGTVISGIFLVIMAPFLAEFALKFFYAEYASVCIFALCAVVSITGSTLTRGAVTALFGLLAATFGISEVDGLVRFDLGTEKLLGGFGLMPVLIGLFAVSQMMQEAAKGITTTKADISALGRVLPTFANIRANIVNYLRSGIIGTFIGILPAVGGAPAALISYSQAKSASKTPEKFGKGIVDGVIAAETANNATIGGALIIALTLGIPGDPVTAILIGGLMIHGLQPGPQLFMNNPEVVYGIYFSVFFGSLAMMIIMLFAAKPLSRVVEVPKNILLPLLFVVAATGIYSMNSRVFDVFTMCCFGVLGYVFDRYRYPLAPFILGYLLGPLVEGNIRQLVEMQGHAWDMLTRPISATFLVCAALFLGFSLYRHRKRGDEPAADNALGEGE